MVHKVYKQYARPLARVVRGLQTSWDPVIAAAYSGFVHSGVVWSPCNRFIAVAKYDVVEIRDATTLNLLSNFDSPPNASALSFSPDGRFFTQFYHGTMVTWDLQTGVSVMTASSKELFMKGPGQGSSPIYSVDGKMLAGECYKLNSNDTFITTHDFSMTRTHIYCVSEGHLVSPLWTHGEFLRFVTIKPGYITIWQVDFTFTHPPEMVKSLPTPDELIDEEAHAKYLFLPTTSRLLITLEDTLLVWDAQHSKYLLKLPNSSPSRMLFSSDGHFFVYLLQDEHDIGIHIWKESPGSYVLHRKLTLENHGGYPKLVLSPNGESIILINNSIIHLLHTTDPFLSSDLTLAGGQPGFILNLSPDEALAAFTRYGENVVTVLDLHSSNPQLEIDVGMDIICLGVTRSTVVAASEEKIGTWKLTRRNTRANIHDSVQVTKFDLSSYPPESSPYSLSVSSDLSYIIIMAHSSMGRLLAIHDVSTGRCLAGPTSAQGVLKLLLCHIQSH